MNTIPEDRALSQSGENPGGAGSTGTWTRSGIRMGSGLLLQSPPSVPVQPPYLNPWNTSSNLGQGYQQQQQQQQGQQDTEDLYDEDASDWEQEVSDRGDLFYVVPYLTNEELDVGSNVPRRSSSSLQPSQKPEPGGKLSRLVRRRESKRDRNRAQVKPENVFMISL